MTLPSSGPISMAMVSNELGISSYGLSLSDSRVRNLAGRPSGTISFSDLLGKSAYTPMSVNAEDTFDEFDTRFGSGQAVGMPTVTISNGTAPYTIQWTMTSRRDAAVLLRYPNDASCLVSYPYSRNSNGSAWAYLSCTVTDGTGRQATATGVRVDLLWYGDL